MEDLIHAAGVAATQLHRGVLLSRRLSHGEVSSRDQPTAFTNKFFGTLGEIALSRIMNVAWTAGGPLIKRGGDIGHKIEVRATTHSNGRCLIYRDDADDAIVALMTGCYPRMCLAGFILAKHGKRDELWSEKGNTPGWWVPQLMLKELVEVENEQRVPQAAA